MKIEDTKNKQTLKELIDTKDFVAHVSVDCTIFGFHNNILKVLLLKYHDLDLWSLPGGFVFNDEDLREAAARVLYERTHLKDLFLKQFHTFGRIDRTENNVHQILLRNKCIEVPKTTGFFSDSLPSAIAALSIFPLLIPFRMPLMKPANGLR